MKLALQNKLFKAFPKLFAQKDLPKEQTCMCWGIDTPDKWYNIIYKLCECIQDYIDSRSDINPVVQVEFTQIKEKFGALRVYTSYHDNFFSGAIALANKLIQNENRQKNRKALAS